MGIKDIMLHKSLSDSELKEILEKIIKVYQENGRKVIIAEQLTADKKDSKILIDNRKKEDIN